jgi:hypothetical protein
VYFEPLSLYMRLQGVLVILLGVFAVDTLAKYQKFEKPHANGFHDPSGTPGYKKPATALPKRFQKDKRTAAQRIHDSL